MASENKRPLSDPSTTTPPKRKRSCNWKEAEARHLVDLVDARKEIPLGKFSARLTYHHKRDAWAEVTASLNVAFNFSRNEAEVEKKWQNIKTTALQKTNANRRCLDQTG